MTATEKLLARASGLSSVAPGDVVYPQPELVIIHDGYVETSYNQLRAAGYGALAQPDRVVFVTDHEVAYATQRAVERGRNIRRIADEWHIRELFDAGRGGHGHIFPMEAGLVRPGMFLFAYDMHCTNFGAVGALAIGVGAEIISVLATGTVWVEVPQTVAIDFTGRLAPAAHPRDVGFLLSRGFAKGEFGVEHDNRVVEFHGSALPEFSLAARVALCNTLTEIGVANVLFGTPPPGIAAESATEYISDADATYADRVTFDLGAVEPQVALPGAPENAAGVSSVAGKRVDHTYLGSCGSGMYEDFVDAARFIAGRKVADGVRMFVVPGTNVVARRLAADGIAQIFLDAGAVMLPSGCGPCAGGMMGPLGPGEVSISTAATNQAGRFGSMEGEVYLGSPLTVAASAVTGEITDPRAVG
jgi:3-isopropylmalate/(R)-2-methylmalate dehydratase large subunit